jgi:hypothetical protein
MTHSLTTRYRHCHCWHIISAHFIVSPDITPMTINEIHLLLHFQVQFVAIFTHQFQLLWTECDYPKGFMVWIGLHGIMFLFLFSDFYKQSYVYKREKVLALKRESENGKVHLNGDSKLHSSVVSCCCSFHSCTHASSWSVCLLLFLVKSR